MAQYRNVTEFLTKIREAYNKAREEYTLLNDKLDKIEALRKRDIERGWANPQFQKEDTETYQKNKAEIKKQLSELINNTNAEYERIKSECEAVFGEYDRATGKKVDLATVELLKSGILSDNEIKALAKDFEGNVAMLRIIGKYAEERGGKDNMEMAVLARNLKTAEFPYREPLERLIFWGNSGIAERDSRATAGNSQFDTMYNELVEQSEGLYITVSE
jgi:gas vesicle protein